MMGIAEFKGSFFDAEKIAKAVNKALVKELSRFGSYTRRTSKGSIKKAGLVEVETGKRIGKKTAERKTIVTAQATSKPGQPPLWHGTMARAKDTAKGKKTQTVSPLRELIFFGMEQQGPTVVIGPAKFKSNPTAPRALEEGGRSMIVRPNGKTREGNYEARPYMKPAFEKEKPKFLDSLKDCVKG